MFKALFGILCFSLGVVVALSAGCKADETGRANLRLEASVGQCKYGKAQDGAWYKNGYEQHLQLSTRCASFGASQALWPTPAGILGWRVNYVDFGTARASTFVPARDEDANNFPSGQNCDKANGYTNCVGQYRQWGRARGITLGPLLEDKTQYGTFGVETGLFRYTSYWRVQGTVPGPGTCSACGDPDYFDWNGAKGTHYTWYAGFTYELHGFFLQVRRYHATYASQANVSGNPLNIGLIAGPLYSVMAGYQWSL